MMTRTTTHAEHYKPADEQPQETASEHSPLPWYVKDGKGVMLGSSGKKDSIFICDRSAGTWVAELPAGKESEANAELIVTAVNSHAELVAALEQLEQYAASLEMRLNKPEGAARREARTAVENARPRH
jgi:hypothetical protein